MTTNNHLSVEIGELIYTGRHCRQSRVSEVIWEGSASVTSGQEARVPAALVMVHAARGEPKEVAVVRLHAERGQDGTEHRRDYLVDARAIYSREWEDLHGDLIGDVDPAMADRIDAAMARDAQTYAARADDMGRRVCAGLVVLTPDA